MTVSNLAVVFGPTLIAAPSHDMAAFLRDSQPLNRLMGFMIEHYVDIVADEPPSEAHANDVDEEAVSQSQSPPLLTYARAVFTFVVSQIFFWHVWFEV